jgi:hypothetical protein
LPKVAEAVCGLAADRALIGGEAVTFRSDGHSDFAALRTKAASARACLVAFDPLSLNGVDLRRRPREERRNELSRLVHGVDGNVQRSPGGRGRDRVRQGLRAGPRGDRVEARRKSGASRSWLKSKNPAYLRSEGGKCGSAHAR